MQNNSENFDKEIDTVGIIIYGKQGKGKTVEAISLALDWERRIYANFNIFQNGKLLNHRLGSAEDVQKVRYSNEPGVIIIDEAGLNANSKDGRSEQNRILMEVLFLVRKKNCSLIWISQRFESIDVNARVLSELIIRMDKIRRGSLHPIFKATKQKQVGTKLKFIHQYRIDCIGWMKHNNITYNTLEASKFIKLNKKSKKTQ